MGKKKGQLTKDTHEAETLPSSDIRAKQQATDTADSLLQNVLSLGGNKKDLDLIDIDDESDIEDLELADDDTEPIKKDDILNLINELGIRKERPEFARKEKKIKLVTSEYVKETSQPTERKKSKNKFKVQDEEVTSTTSSEPVKLETTAQSADLSSLLTYINKGYVKRSHSIIKSGRWLAQLESKDTPVHSGPPHKHLNTIEQFACQVLEDDTETFNSSQSGSDKSNKDWMKKMVSSGTLADRAAALTTLIQEDVVHNLSSLEGLVNMVKKKDRRESMAAIGSLKDIFIDLLPNKRKLRTFPQMPIDSLQTTTAGNKDTQDRLLALWYFESKLKKVYKLFVDAVLAATFDTVTAHKLTSLKVILDLLTHKPELEQELLSGLVNKLGDPERKVAANTAHLLSILVRKHPNMKSTVAGEVENILYRPNIAAKAQYYAICFLNQMLLSSQDKDLSVKLITIYFSFFKASIKSNEIDSKLMSSLLVGVVRAFPFAKGSEKLDIEGQMSAVYKLVHTVNKLDVSIQALTLLYQVCTSSDSMTDRYYTSLYAKLLDPGLKNSSKQSMFLNLVYKSMKADPSDRRCKAFIKRLLQICAFHSPTFICAALLTISEVKKLRPSVICLHSHLVGDEDSEEEHFVDAVDSDSEGEVSVSKPDGKGKGWTHNSSKQDAYDSSVRNPLYCHADKSIETELVILSRHFHPSVVVFANRLLQSHPVIYTGDPMNDFSLHKFLDRFVFRNPKKVSKQGKAERTFSSHKKQKEVGVSGLPVNTDDFYKLESHQVPADQLFFHSYFHKLTDGSKHKLGSKLGTAEREEASDDSDVDDDDFDSYLSKYEKSLYRDMKEDEFGADFASNFKKKSGGNKNSEEDSDSGLSDDEVNYEFNLEDFGLDEDDVGEDGSPSKPASREMFEEDSDGSGDLPLDMDDDFDNVEGLFAPAEDFNEEDIDFSDDEFSSLDFSGKGKSKLNKANKSSKNDSSLFAAADAFADLLDEESADKRDTITSGAVINRGKTGVKQLEWEDKQERWLSGKNRKRVNKATSHNKGQGHVKKRKRTK